MNHAQAWRERDIAETFQRIRALCQQPSGLTDAELDRHAAAITADAIHARRNDRNPYHQNKTKGARPR